MTSLIGPDMWLEMYFRNAIQGDMDWVEIGNGSFTYWPARLAQTTSAEVVSEFGDIKWRVRTRLVDEVADPTMAKEACLALNAYTAGWSFAYDESDRSIDAILAVYAPITPFPNDPMTRLSEAALLSAWMADVIAEDVAERVDGRPAFSYPAHQDGVREVFDTNYFYSDALRQRPEWVCDRTRDQFPALGDVSAELAQGFRVDPDWVVIDRGQFIEFNLVESGAFRVAAYFAEHPIFGWCWRTYLSLRGPDSEYAVNAAHKMTWQLFDDEESSLAGGWTYVGGSLAFEQWTTMSELRRLESFSTFFGHSASELVERAKSLTDAAQSTQGHDWDAFRLEGGLTGEARTELGKDLIGAISRLAPQLPDVEGPKSDVGLLWLERRTTLLTAAWFNPLGPTVATLELCENTDEPDSYLVYFMRHPFLPDYRAIGRVDNDDQLGDLFAEGLRTLLGGGSLPTMVMLTMQENFRSTLSTVFHDAVVQVAQEQDIDVFAKAAKVGQAMGSPWNLAPGAQPPGLDAKYSRERCGVGDLEADALPIQGDEVDPGFSAWWAQVGKPENVVAHFSELPDAWDAALNLLIEAGEIQNFGAGPCFLTYSDRATVFPKPMPRSVPPND